MVFSKWNPWKKKSSLDVSKLLASEGSLDRSGVKGVMLHISVKEFEKYKGLKKEELFKHLESKFQTVFVAIEVIDTELVIWK